jgi:hypothetical protein
MSFIAFVLIGCSSPTAKAQYACYGSCDVQALNCQTLLLDECYELCDWVIESIQETDGCLNAHTQLWGCDATLDWTCSPDSTVVAQPIDDACQEQRQTIPDECIP